MLTTIGSIVGVTVMVLGVLWAGVTWVLSRLGVQQSQFEKLFKSLLDQIEPKDLLVVPGKIETVHSRIAALECADTLMKYFESSKSEAGQQAMAAVVQAIFAQPNIKQ